MDEAYLQRIQNVLARYPNNSLFPEYRKGANTCPHCKKKNKFYVYDTGVKCYSRSCKLHKYRDLIKFYGEQKGLSYNQSLLELEGQLGLSANSLDKRNEVLIEALNIYHHFLFQPESKEALQYLLGRGFLKEFLMTSMIGYAPPYNVLQAYGLEKKDLNENYLLDYKGNDYFRNRIIFPIYARDGNLVHLNGRYMGDIPKDKEGDDVFPRFKCSKSINRFKITDFLLLEQNIKSYVKKKKVFLTEGCTDTFTLYQYGLPVLGLMGIQKLASHYYKLKDFDIIYCIFDNDRFPIDHEFFPNQYKSWSVILPNLIDLQHMLPNTQFKVWTVPTELGQDLNDYFNQGKYKANISRIYKESVDLLDFLIEEYKYDFSKHIEIAKLFKLKNKNLDQLNKVIPKDYSYTDYLLKVI